MADCSVSSSSLSWSAAMGLRFVALRDSNYDPTADNNSEATEELKSRRGGDYDLNRAYTFGDSKRKALRNTLLDQEEIFRKQVVELHRIYWTQKNIMKDFGWKELDEYREREYSCKDDLRLSLSINRNCYQNGYREKDINLSTKCIIDLEESTEPISRGDVKVTSAIFYDYPVASSGVKQDSTESIQSSLSFAKGSRGKCLDLEVLDLNRDLIDNSSFHLDDPPRVNSESCSETKEDVDELDDMIRKGAISLAYFALDNSSRDQDGFSEAGETKEMRNTKKDTRQDSSESYESMVLKLPESSMDDYCVSSKPLEVCETSRKDSGVKWKRGRRLKDFKKDILPHLSSLSSSEISEDMKLIESVLRIRSREYKRLRSKMNDGHNRSSPARSRRSRTNYVSR